MLREDFLPEYGLTVSGFAKALKVSRQTVNKLLRGTTKGVRSPKLEPKGGFKLSR